MAKRTAKEQWKQLYRSMRVLRRESLKAFMDGMIYGTGMIRIPAEGDVQHIPRDEWKAAPATEGE